MIRTAETKIKATKTSSDATETTPGKGTVKTTTKARETTFKATDNGLSVDIFCTIQLKKSNFKRTYKHACTHTHDENK